MFWREFKLDLSSTDKMLLYLLPGRPRATQIDHWQDARHMRELFERDLPLTKKQELAELLEFWTKALEAEKR